MKLKPINWVAQDNTHLAVFMGITLAVHLDKDGTFTASLSGIPNQRPEFQKMFDTLDEAKAYAMDTLLNREINKCFVVETTETFKPDDVFYHVWEDFKDPSFPKPATYILHVSFHDFYSGKHTETVGFLHSKGYRRVDTTEVHNNDMGYAMAIKFELIGD